MKRLASRFDVVAYDAAPKSTSRSNVPIVARVARDHALTRRLAWVPAGIVLLGAIGAVAQVYSAAAIPAHPSSASGPAAHLPR